MGSAGSDHDLSVKKIVVVCGNGEEAVSQFGTLSIQRVDDSECAYHIVECKLAGTSVSLQQKFTSTGPKDPEGRAAAYSFALSTGCLPAFRAFLFERPEFVNSGLACLTDQSLFTVFINLRKNAVLGLCFSAAVCRFRDGSLRSVSFRSGSEQVGFEQVTAFFHSPKLRSWVLRAVKRGTSFAGELENCRPDGIPTAKCKRCGELESADYSNQKSQQASEECCCSACLMMERKLIFAIRLEEQGEVAESWEMLQSEAGSLYTQTDFEACCVCGCEDNEDLDDLVPCICQSSEAVVHTSCSAACKPVASLRASMSSSTPWCLICGQGGVVSPHGGLANDGIGARGLKRSMTPSQVAGGEMKRPRTSSTDGVKQGENIPNVDCSSNNIKINNTVQTEAKEPDCTKIGSARHVWRSADTPAVVPFKKRRIQISEAPRSPSPPLKPLFCKDVSYSPQRPLLESTSSKPVSMLPKCPSPKPGDSNSKNAASLFFSTPFTSPKSLTPVRCIPDITPTEATSPLPRSCSSDTVPPKSRSLSPNQICSSLKILSPKHASPPKSFSRTPDSSPARLPRLPLVRMLEESANPLKSPEQQSSQVCTPHCDRNAPKVIQETDNFYICSSSISANQNQPSSSQEVEDGELVISTEKISDEFDIPDELPEVSSQVAQGHDSQGSRFNALKAQDDHSGLDLNTNMETWDRLSDKVARARLKMGKSSRTVGVLVGHKFNTNSHLVRANEPLKVCRNEHTTETTSIDNDHQCRVSPCKEADAGSEAPVAGKVQAVRESEGFGKLEADVSGLGNFALKVGKDDCERQRLHRYKSAEKVERQSGLQRLYRYKSAEKVERQSGLQRTKAEDRTELAQESEGEEHADHGDFDCREGDHTGMNLDDRSPILEDEAYWKGEDASGNPFFWERNVRLGGSEGERKGVHVKKFSTPGRVKSSGWDQLPEGFESAEEALKAAQEVIARRGRGSWVSFGGRGLASFSAHRFNSGRDDTRESSKRFGDRYLNDSSHSRDSFNHTRGLDDSGDDCYLPRGRFSGRAAGGGYGRGCHKGWAENRQGDSIDEWGQGRHRSTSGFSSQGPTNAVALAAARVESSGFVVGPDGTLSRGSTSSRVMRSTFVKSHGVRGLHRTGRAPSADMDGGSNFSKRGSPGVDRCMGRSSKIGIDLGERRVRQGASTGFAGSMSDRRALPGRGFGDRYGGSSYIRRTVEPRRSESPRRMHLPDHPYANNCRSPGSRPEPRVKRSRFSPPSSRFSPPSSEPFSRSKFHLPSARIQHSPPPFNKWPHDRREGENFREKDFKRPVPRYGAPGRTSPHVVHGSSLMDDRDLQVLAGTRSSSGARGGLSSLRDESPELRQPRRTEEEGRIGSISKDSDNGDITGIVYKRDRSRDDEKQREPYRPLSRSSGGHRRSSSFDGIDEVTPRRHGP